jgi:hypothetical protein
MSRKLRNEREAHMTLDCCTQNGFKDGCGQGDKCPHWGRVSSNVRYMEEIRKPIPCRAVQVTPQQARDMDDTAGFGGIVDYVPGMMFFPNLAVRFRKRVGGINWMGWINCALLAMFFGASWMAIAGVARLVKNYFGV